jgi:hypothetical protein
MQHIMDVFYFELKQFIDEHPAYRFSYYGISFDGSKPTYDATALARADVIVVPSEAEFMFYVPGLLHTLEVARSNERVRALAPLLANKHLVVLRSDRRDDEELFRTYTWPETAFTYHEVDELAFPLSLNALKIAWYRQALQSRKRLDITPAEKRYDVVYWGTDKRKTLGGVPSGDIRHLLLKAVNNAPDLTKLWIGLLSVKRHVKFSPMADLLPRLAESKMTFCSNWRESSALTARYFEAIGATVLPFVYRDYGQGVLPLQPWQRFDTPDELLERLREAQQHAAERFATVESALLDVIPPVETYHALFDKLLTEALEKPSGSGAATNPTGREGEADVAYR